MKIEVSNGEVFDKLSILEIKRDKMINEEKLKYIKKEYDYLEAVASSIGFSLQSEIYAKLRDVNLSLWETEDKIRLKEDRGEFGEEFIELARSVYKLNDQRFRLKNKINMKTDSNFKEQKNYKGTDNE